MNDFQKLIVSFLVGPFITGRPVDNEDVTHLLQKAFPDTPLDQINAVIRDIAAGIGVRFTETSEQNSGPTEAL